MLNEEEDVDRDVNRVRNPRKGDFRAEGVAEDGIIVSTIICMVEQFGSSCFQYIVFGSLSFMEFLCIL